MVLKASEIPRILEPVNLSASISHASPNSMAIENLVAIWQLQPHPEGGWYREIQRSVMTVQRSDGAKRSAMTTVLFLLDAASISRWHCVHGGDEIWTFIDGAPLSLFRHQQVDERTEEVILSRSNPVASVDAGVWMAARSQGDFSLVSCCVGPGFCFEDFEMLSARPKADHPRGIRPDLL